MTTSLRLDTRLRAVAAAFCVWVGPLRGELEWRGMIERNNEPTFALTNPETGSSKWVPLGGTFEMYSVASYDSLRQLLVLTKDGVRLELTLASSHVAPVRSDNNEELRRLSGLPLADALAKRGDVRLQQMLANHSKAVAVREELLRKLAELERAQGDAPAAGSAAGTSKGSEKSSSSAALEAARAEVQAKDGEVARLTTEIGQAAIDARAALLGS